MYSQVGIYIFFLLFFSKWSLFDYWIKKNFKRSFAFSLLFLEILVCFNFLSNLCALWHCLSLSLSHFAPFWFFSHFFGHFVLQIFKQFNLFSEVFLNVVILTFYRDKSRVFCSSPHHERICTTHFILLKGILTI